MSFAVPAFPLVCGIWTGPYLSMVFRDSKECNLAMGRRAYQNYLVAQGPTQVFGASPSLLLPAGTDVRDASTASGDDMIEVPIDSGRWYQVTCVEDVGKGFDNEYRVATLAKASELINSELFPGLFWPTPIP